MKTRIITAIVAIAILVPVLIFSNTFLLPLMLSLCTVIGLYEMASCLDIKRNWALTLPLYLIGAVLPFGIRLVEWIPNTVFMNKPLNNLRNFGLVLLSLVVIYLFAVLTFSKGKIKFADASCWFFTSLYIIAGFSSILYLHDYTTGGEYVYLMVFIGAWVTDTFAYFTGMLLGKHKLIPEVSPKKTVEGSIGGIIFCVISITAFGFLVSVYTEFMAPSLWIFAIVGMVISIASQIGDLSMSVIKRTYGIKDYGKLFPGHGGVLDRFDSILAVSLILSAFCSIIPLFWHVVE